jgi:hypothetical protein
MPRDLFIIGIAKDGKTSLLVGRELENAKTRAQFNDWRSGAAMPKGIVEAHLYDSEEGRIGIAFDEVARRAEVHAANIKDIEKRISDHQEYLGRAKTALGDLEKAKIESPTVGHTRRAVAGFEAEIASLKEKLNEARKAADEHAKGPKNAKG